MPSTAYTSFFVEKAVSMFSHLAERHPANKLVKHKILLDICILRNSIIANKQLAKDIEKIFATEQKMCSDSSAHNLITVEAQAYCRL